MEGRTTMAMEAITTTTRINTSVGTMREVQSWWQTPMPGFRGKGWKEIFRTIEGIKETMGTTVVETTIRCHAQAQPALKRLLGCRVLAIAGTVDPPITRWLSAWT